MGLIKKSDVKNHLSERHHKHIHISPLSQPDATGFSGTNQLPGETSGTEFAKDFTGDHKSVVSSDAPSDHLGAHAAPKQ